MRKCSAFALQLRFRLDKMLAGDSGKTETGIFTVMDILGYAALPLLSADSYVPDVDLPGQADAC